ncbi:MAG: sulfotransferase family protein [Anaerolineales bacterium]|jgi:hypothetical protein
MRDYPFFIIGHPRSGTTLLRFMLSTHSRLYIPEETGFLPFLNVNPDKPLMETEIQDLLTRIGKLNYLWQDLPITAGQISAVYQQPTLAVVVNELYQQQAAQHDASRWGDKTPLYIQYIPNILEIFPQAQFIHMIRDGRDAALSALEKWGSESAYMDLYYLLKNWVRNVSAGRNFGRYADRDRYLEVHYESLVAAPEVVLRQICVFLGENFESSMLDHTNTAHQAGPGPAGHFKALQPVFDVSVYRWKTEMGSFQRKLSAKIAGDLLLELGYELPDDGPMRLRERVLTLFLALRFSFFDLIRTVLYRTGIITLNRTMRTPKPEQA